jgi:protocatechuate 3,4-dioxygenase beta subunit
MVCMIELATRHDGGLAHDLPLVRRRRMTGLAGGTTVAALAGMTLGKPELATRLAATLIRSGIVRSDVRRSFGTANGLARGVPLTVRLRLVSANSGQPIAGHAVYLWQCDREGRYSLYAPELTGENYLRGLQASDAAGWVRFTSIFPGGYEGSWPHLHVEVYPSLTETGAGDQLHSTRLALPADVCAQVYARRDYADSRAHLATAHLAADGRAPQMAAVTGEIGRGFTAVRHVSL